MSGLKVRQVWERALLAMWGMATLVLLFCVVFLAYAVAQRGENPLRLSGEAAKPRVRQPEAGGQSLPKEVQLFFADRNGASLVPESRTLECGDSTVENCRRALEALIEGPQTELTPIFPAGTRVRALYLLDDGELVIDFSRELARPKQSSVSMEALLLYGVAGALTQPGLRGENDESVRTVRFLIEGAPPGDSFRSHLDLSQALSPDRRWVMPVERR